VNHTIASSADQRLLGAGWFGVWGLLAAGTIYLALERSPGFDLMTLLYVLLPGVAAVPAGALVGPWILDPARAEPLRAAALGLLAAFLAHLLFGALFALGMTWLDDYEGFLGLWFLASGLGLPTMGLFTLPVGALAGWLLHVSGRRIG
jgi:hypothetical protein